LPSKEEKREKERDKEEDKDEDQKGCLALFPTLPMTQRRAETPKQPHLNFLLFLLPTMPAQLPSLENWLT
jgi:hypothetical protein